LATGDGEGSAHVWDLDSGREVMTVSTYSPPRGVAGGAPDVSPIVVLSPDGRLLATVGSDDSLRVWEVPTGARVWALAPEAGRHTINPVFSPDGTRLLVCSWLEPPRVVEIATGETIISPSGGGGCGSPFSADSSRIAFAMTRGDSEDIEVWDPRQRTRVATASYADIAPGDLRFAEWHSAQTGGFSPSSVAMHTTSSC
jgi:WD40 repeat protein